MEDDTFSFNYILKQIMWKMLQAFHVFASVKKQESNNKTKIVISLFGKSVFDLETAISKQ